LVVEVVLLVGFEPNMTNRIGWEADDPKLGLELDSSSVNDDSLNDFFVLTRSSTIVGYAPAI